MPEENKRGDETEPKRAPDAAGPASSSAARPEAAAPERSGNKPSWDDYPPEQLRQIIIHLQKDNEAAQAKIQEEKDQTLRLLADMDNLRKRTEREKEDMSKYAVSQLARDMVDVGDNFQRAIQAVPPEAAEADPALKSLLEGVTLAERAFLAALERNGVSQIDAMGQPFNPHQHQAVMEQEDTSVPAGTVLQVFQAGYMVGERCLRPAMVVVSKGGQKANRQTETNGSPAAQANGDPAAAQDGSVAGDEG